MLGGPLYQFCLRTCLLKPPLDLARRRTIVVCLFVWLPLFLLSLFAGNFLTGVKVPFLFDIDTHVRFLGALASLVIAESMVHKYLAIIVPQFLEHDIIAPEDHSKFNKIITSAMRLRNSFGIELLLLALAFTCGHFIWNRFSSLDMSTWYAAVNAGQTSLTPAGYWYVFVSIPLFQFIGFRWYFRFFIWYQFLWRVARLPLRFNVLHPDKVGGLGFLASSMFAFAPVLLAHTILLAGMIANRIWHQGATLIQFEMEIIAVIIFLLLLVALPLLFFMNLLAKTKRAGLREYSMVVSQYVNAFRQKWFITDSKNKETILGSPDLQSLADLSNSYNVASEMRFIPLSARTIGGLTVFIVLPLTPLILTVIPFVEIINRLVGVII